MDVGAGAEKGVGGPSLVVERQALGRRRHERRGAARQQHKQLVVRAGAAAGNRERPVPRVFAGGRRHRMAAHDAFEGRDEGTGFDADDEARPDPGTEDVEGRPRHGRRRFACRDDTDRPGTGSERLSGEAAGVNRSNTRPDN